MLVSYGADNELSSLYITNSAPSAPRELAAITHYQRRCYVLSVSSNRQDDAKRTSINRSRDKPVDTSPFNKQNTCWPASATFTTVFTRQSSYCCKRVLAIAILSVCPSVRPSHGWISQKRCKLGLPNFHRQLHGTIVMRSR